MALVNGAMYACGPLMTMIFVSSGFIRSPVAGSILSARVIPVWLWICTLALPRLRMSRVTMLMLMPPLRLRMSQLRRSQAAISALS